MVLPAPDRRAAPQRPARSARVRHRRRERRTLRAAADLDYELTVIADCCLDRDPEVHRVLLEKVFPRQADVIDVAGWERLVG